MRPVLEEQVIHANGGLIVTRPVGSWLEGPSMYVSVYVHTYIPAIRRCASISMPVRVRVHECHKSSVRTNAHTRYNDAMTSQSICHRRPNVSPIIVTTHRPERADFGALPRARRPPGDLLAHEPGRLAQRCVRLSVCLSACGSVLSIESSSHACFLPTESHLDSTNTTRTNDL